MNSAARINQAIQETRRFIALEERRDPELRPVAVAELLAKYKLHLVKLEKMLDDLSKMAL
jgi:hypothetical protein